MDVKHGKNHARNAFWPQRFDLIWTSSYGSVSVDDICVRAGGQEGQFLPLFPSKADLALSAYEEHWRLKQPSLDAIFFPSCPRWSGFPVV